MIISYSDFHFIIILTFHSLSIYNIDILNVESSDATVDNYVSQVLDDNNISLSSKFTSLTKTSVDFDGDGVWEYFYVVSNAFPIDFYPENIEIKKNYNKKKFS